MALTSCHVQMVPAGFQRFLLHIQRDSQRDRQEWEWRTRLEGRVGIELHQGRFIALKRHQIQGFRVGFCWIFCLKTPGCVYK